MIQLVVPAYSPNMRFSILYSCWDNFDGTNGEKKEKQTQGKTRKGRLDFNSMIHFVVNLYIKFELSIIYSCGDILDEKMSWNYGRRADGTMGR